MQALSQTFGYAVLALSCLARGCAGRAHATAIAACSGVPLPYLRKVLRNLADAGLVVSRRGRDGGVELARDAEQISLFDIAEVVDPAFAEKRCLMGLSACSDEDACPLHAFWKVERERIDRELRSLSLAAAARFGWTRDARSRVRCKGAPGEALDETSEETTADPDGAATGRAAREHDRSRRIRR